MATLRWDDAESTVPKLALRLLEQNGALQETSKKMGLACTWGCGLSLGGPKRATLETSSPCLGAR